MGFSLPSLSLVCDSYGLSGRSAAAIASAVLEDIAIISHYDKTQVIHRSKIRPEGKGGVIRLIEFTSTASTSGNLFATCK